MSSVRSISSLRGSAALLDRGEKVTQQTLLWDANKGEARVSRTKEGSHDYRYFPEPDLLPLVLDAKWLSEIKASVPELPADRKKRIVEEYKLVCRRDREAHCHARACRLLRDHRARMPEIPRRLRTG